MKLVVGLGNLGDRYSRTRHNLGFMILDELAKKHEATFSENKSLHSEIAELQLENGKVYLAKPTTMMNGSGEAIKAISSYYKIAPEEVLVVLDDFNLEFGLLRVRQGGESGGHNGLNSIIESFSRDFWRFRIGVASGYLDILGHSEFVTANFAPDEQRQVKRIIERGAELLEEYLVKGHLAHDTTRLV